LVAPITVYTRFYYMGDFVQGAIFYYVEVGGYSLWGLLCPGFISFRQPETSITYLPHNIRPSGRPAMRVYVRVYVCLYVSTPLSLRARPPL